MTAPFLPSRWVITPADNADDPDIFPFLKGQSFLIKKAPLWRTSINESISGRERRRPLWSYPIWRFRLAHEFLRDASDLLELQRLMAFFNSKNGSERGFFYLDRSDYSAIDNRFGTGDGATTTFQITRTTAIGGISFSEPVRGFDGMPTIKINGALTASFTIGPFGQITFGSAPAIGTALSWTGTFFFLCRFENDELDAIGQLGQGVWQNAGLDFRSFKP